MRVNENIAYGEVSHRTINASKDECGDIGMEENVSYGQVHCRSTNIMFRNEAYGVFPITGDYEDV